MVQNPNISNALCFDCFKSRFFLALGGKHFCCREEPTKIIPPNRTPQCICFWWPASDGREYVAQFGPRGFIPGPFNGFTNDTFHDVYGQAARCVYAVLCIPDYRFCFATLVAYVSTSICDALPCLSTHDPCHTSSLFFCSFL